METDTVGSTQSLETPQPRTAAEGPLQFFTLLLQGENPLAGSVRYSLEGLHHLFIGRGRTRLLEQSDLNERPGLRARIADGGMSQNHAGLFRRDARWIVEDQRSKNGIQVNGVRVDRAVLQGGDLVQVGTSMFLFHESPKVFPEAASHLDSRSMETNPPVLRTFLQPLAQDLRKAESVCRAGLSILIEGEPGTGKEALAVALHDRSIRGGPFVTLHCGTASPAEVRALLAPSSASAGAPLHPTRPDLEGTLCLQEVADLSVPAQEMLAQVLEERERARSTIGAPLLALTSKPLEELARTGAFNRQLFARLCGFRLCLPRLAERPSDFGIAIGAILGKHCGPLTLTPAVVLTLLRWPWPGNFRELEQCIAAMVAVSDTGKLDLPSLPPQFVPAMADAQPQSPLSPEDAQLRQALVDALRTHEGNISAVARAMGKERIQIRRWLKRFQLHVSDR